MKLKLKAALSGDLQFSLLRHPYRRTRRDAAAFLMVLLSIVDITSSFIGWLFNWVTLRSLSIVSHIVKLVSSKAYKCNSRLLYNLFKAFCVESATNFRHG
jgi:hypothetical protein